jgi:hypothetical protein
MEVIRCVNESQETDSNQIVGACEPKIVSII